MIKMYQSYTEKVKCFSLMTLLLLVVGFTEVIAQQVNTSSLAVKVKKHKIISIENKLNQTKWSVNPELLYNIDTKGVKADLKVAANKANQIELILTIQNISNDTVYPEPVFPQLKGICLKKDKAENLYYLYPKQGWVHSNRDITENNIYSSIFPMQFMDIYHADGGGIYMMSNDTGNHPKSYYFSKKDGKVDMHIRFRSIALAPGEKWILPPVVIGAHEGDWHEAFYAYRDWLKSWYKPYTPRKQWFKDVFNFRQVFLHTIFGEVGAWNPSTKKVDLISKLEADKKAFGGVDYVHIFDWMRTPKGRIVDYEPWEFLGGHEDLKSQIEQIKAQGIPVGLYHEGYIMNKKSKIGLAHGKEWQQLDTLGNPYVRFGPGNYYPCPLIPGWQEFLSDLVNHSSTLLGANGVYVDQYGFCWQYGCHNPAHNHDARRTTMTNNLQVYGETQMMKKIKDKISTDKVLYVEEIPSDVYSQYIDGCFGYGIEQGRLPQSHNPSVVNLVRFAYPDFKILEILHIDKAVGNDQEGVKHIFFNGEGIWIEGPLNDPGWFPEEIRATIRKTYAILSENKDAFNSNDAIPLVPTLNSSIHANYFPGKNKKVWTLFNINNTCFSGDIISIPHTKGATYYDAWNQQEIFPVYRKGNAIISLKIEGRDVGCVIQQIN